MRAPTPCSVAALALALAASFASAQTPSNLASVPETNFAEMRYRLVGPFRAGRTVAVDGIPAQPNVFFMAATNGGVWKTTDFGNTWNPIFDGQPTGSIGCIAVAPSDPKIIYVGSGEGLQRPDLSVGDGIYKSTDGGKSWTHLGLRDGQQIARLLVDPKDPNRVFAAVLGHPYGPNEERGVFLSTDGAQTWTKVLYKDPDTGAMDLAFDPTNSQTVYADLWSARQTPWEGSSIEGTTSGLFKSTDGGHTWNRLTQGLPTNEQRLGRIGFTVAPSDPKRMYADVDAGPLTGVYRSDDAGDSWTRVNSEGRVTGRGQDFAWIRVDPRNPDIVYTVDTSMYKSEDGGKTFTAFKGAPGGDDYHSIWINPLNPDIMLLGVDQGATLTVNGGQTWSSWYNQPTAQFYHVSTDNQYPYWIYGGQQESGSVGIKSRGDNGAISFRDWRTVGVEEYGYVAPDPLHPNLIYGGKATVFDANTGGVQQVGPNVGRGRGGEGLRSVRTMPLLFSTVDNKTLFLGSQYVMKTTDGGHSWQTVSPDLARSSYEVPANFGSFAPRDPERGRHKGVVYAIAPSKLNMNTIWAGTDDGLIHLTHDAGANWINVTPPELNAWAKVSQLDASKFDDRTVYAAINKLRLDDLHPAAFRTHDDGKTWKSIVEGLPVGAVVNAIREDPKTPHLLYAGTELGVFVSFNDGDRWQPLQLNLPVTSVRDLVVHEDDLVIATHGRSFWVLDDVTPLRQQTALLAAKGPYLFAPAAAVRVRRDANTDTPLPPEEPVGQNPPDGAMLDYFLPAAPKQPLKIEILDAGGKLVRTYLSTDRQEPDEPLNVPTYWVRPPKVLSTTPGMHRWVWDLRSAPPASLTHDYPIAAIYHDTPREPLGVFVLPGTYTVRLTVDGRSLTQTVKVDMDPRNSAGAAALAEAHDLATKLHDGMDQTIALTGQIRALHTDLDSLAAKTKDAAILATIQAIQQQASNLEGERVRGVRGAAQAPQATGAFQPLSRLNGSLGGVYNVINNADAAPTTQGEAAAADALQALATTVAAFNTLKKEQLPALNKQLEAAKLPPLNLRAQIVDSVLNPYDEGEEP
jgi:photosystem II stability/assembly factor-like uncharacterized protein